MVESLTGRRQGTARIRVVVAAENIMFREALVSMLRTCADFEVVGATAGGLAAVNLCAGRVPDVAIVDLHAQDGAAGIAGICAVSPRTGVIVLSAYDDRM